jgi:nucleotide-binding universal stress UspA family protein
MFRTILLAVDGSKYAEKAVDLTKQFAAATHDEVVLLHVTELLPSRFLLPDDPDEEVDKDTIDLTRRYVDELEAAGIKARAELRHIQYGHVARAITGLADELDAGLIVMGSHGRSDLGALLLGSVAHKALHLTGRPVLIAR